MDDRDPEPAVELQTFEGAAPRLRVWLITEHTGVHRAESLVQRRLAKGLHACLALEVPRAVRLVHPSQLRAWGDPDLGDLWRRARAQTIARLADADADEVAIAQHELFGRTTCTAITGDSPLLTSHLLDLERVFAPRQPPPAGAIVVVPTRHTLLVRPVVAPLQDAEAILAAMRKAGEVLHENGPGSLSPELYWWRPGALEHVRTVRDGEGRLRFGASEAFIRAVQG